MTVCLVNNKKYIGKYENKESDNYLGSGKLLKFAIKKHGKENFERLVLERFSNKKDCREGEKKWIKLFDAVNSKEFYNIGEGGEGGNTYAGIVGEDRILLIAKLKTRRRGKPKKGLTTVFNVLSKRREKVSIEEFEKNPYLVGVSCKGFYSTPAGVFCSALVAGKYNDNLDYTVLSKRCKNPNKVVRKYNIGTDRRLTEQDLGKTYYELGYSFISLENVELAFIKKNNIIKK